MIQEVLATRQTDRYFIDRKKVITDLFVIPHINISAISQLGITLVSQGALVGLHIITHSSVNKHSHRRQHKRTDQQTKPRITSYLFQLLNKNMLIQNTTHAMTELVGFMVRVGIRGLRKSCKF